MTVPFSPTSLLTLALSALAAVPVQAQVSLLAKGTLTGSPAGAYADLSGLSGTLENGVPSTLLGGLGSGLAHVSGDTFLAVPDRGPNAVSYNSAVDDTVSYINRFHTVKMHLQASAAGSALPFAISPELEATTLLNSVTPLVYGDGAGLGVGSGAPKENSFFRHYFTGRSDNFNPNRSSEDANDARLDPESIRVSADGVFVYISDEYGPYIYQFLRGSGLRVRTFRVPDALYVATPKPTGDAEQAANVQGRVPNKGFEGLALTPDGRTLVAILQASTIQDAAEGGAAASVLRMVAVDTLSGKVKGEHAYNLTTGSGVSDLVALNDHEFIVDERDGKGLGDGSKAKVKQFFKIDLKGATDVTEMDGTAAAAHAVPKTLFVDLLQVLEANGFTSTTIPAKIEGLAFGPDVATATGRVHTLWVANDNDFLQDYGGVAGSNPNQFFVVGFTDKDLAGSAYQPEAHYHE